MSELGMGFNGLGVYTLKTSILTYEERHKKYEQFQNDKYIHAMNFSLCEIYQKAIPIITVDFKNKTIKYSFDADITFAIEQLQNKINDYIENTYL